MNFFKKIYHMPVQYTQFVLTLVHILIDKFSQPVFLIVEGSMLHF